MMLPFLSLIELDPVVGLGLFMGRLAITMPEGLVTVAEGAAVTEICHPYPSEPEAE